MGNDLKKNFELNIFTIGNYNIEDISNLFKNNYIMEKDYQRQCNKYVHPNLKWTFYFIDGIIKSQPNEKEPTNAEVFSKTIKIIQDDVNNNSEKNSVLCFIDSINKDFEAADMIKSFSNINYIYHPMILFLVKDNNTSTDYLFEYIKKNNIEFDTRNIRAIKYSSNNSAECYLTLLDFCSYFNELGDEFSYPENLLNELSISEDNDIDDPVEEQNKSIFRKISDKFKKKDKNKDKDKDKGSIMDLGLGDEDIKNSKIEKNNNDIDINIPLERKENIIENNDKEIKVEEDNKKIEEENKEIEGDKKEEENKEIKEDKKEDEKEEIKEVKKDDEIKDSLNLIQQSDIKNEYPLFDSVVNPDIEAVPNAESKDNPNPIPLAPVTESQVSNIVQNIDLNIEESEITQDSPAKKADDDMILKVRLKYRSTLNFLVVGRPGVGKSTFINTVLGVKKCREGKGFSVTKKITKYLHPLAPIAVYDTPGFEDSKDIKQVIKLIADNNYDLLQGKNKFHAVFYLINTGSDRTILGDELKLSKKLLELEIPIYFVCTKSLTRERGENFGIILKTGLIQAFGKDSKLLNHIYPVQLVKENYGGIEPFGLKELFTDIYNVYKNDKIDIERFVGVNNDDNAKILDIIKDSFFFKEIKSVNDLVEHAKFLSRASIASHCVLSGAIGLAPLPIPDQPVLMSLEVTMVGTIAWAYGITKSKKQIKSLIASFVATNAVAFGAKFLAKALKASIGLMIAGIIIDSAIGVGSFAFIGISCQKIFERELKKGGMLIQIREMAENFNDGVDYLLNIHS